MVFIINKIGNKTINWKLEIDQVYQWLGNKRNQWFRKHALIFTIAHVSCSQFRIKISSFERKNEDKLFKFQSN